MSQSKEPSDSDRVFALVKQIPEGKVMNYGQVGMSLDPPITARTVGWIMHRSERMSLGGVSSAQTAVSS